MIYVVAMNYYNAGAFTAHFGTASFSTRPTDTPANTVVLNRVDSPALIRRDIFDIGTTGGASRVGYGELVLRNDDGALDWINDVGLDGRTLTVHIADDTDRAYPSGYTPLLVGTMEQATVGLDTVRIRLRDRQMLLTQAFQPNQYGGTNVLPAGVDGIETDLKGKPIPRVLGGVFNIEPVCVNTSKLIYQVEDGTLRDITALYDGGAFLTRDATGDYTDQADMEANEPLAGEYRVWIAGGMFRLGSTPAGQLTCDVLTGLSPANRTAAALFRQVCENAGIATGDISSDDLVALDADNRATLGLYVREDTTNADVLDDIARSVGAWWGADTSGIMRIERLEAPSGSAVLELDGDNIVEGSLQRVPLNDGGLPVYRVKVRGCQNYTVQTSGLFGSVGAARRARLAQPYQDGIDEDTAVQTTYLLAPELTVETKLVCLGAVQTEAERLQALYGVKRDRFECEVFGNAAFLGAIDLGIVVNVTYTRFSLDAGKLFRVLGYQINPTAGTASLTLWG